MRKMLKGHLPRVISHQVYSYTKIKQPSLSAGTSFKDGEASHGIWWESTGPRALFDMIDVVIGTGPLPSEEATAQTKWGIRLKFMAWSWH